LTRRYGSTSRHLPHPMLPIEEAGETRDSGRKIADIWRSPMSTKSVATQLTSILPLLMVGGSAVAQIPVDNDPMMWAYNYAYSRAICDSASPKERASPHKTDATVNCWQAQMAKEKLKANGYWCVTNLKADIGVPCTPAMAKSRH
jgi:hypothetical protein